MKLSPYRKAIVGVVTPFVGLGILYLNSRFGVDLSPVQTDVVDAIGAAVTTLGTGIGVWLTRNIPKA